MLRDLIHRLYQAALKKALIWSITVDVVALQVTIDL